MLNVIFPCSRYCKSDSHSLNSFIEEREKINFSFSVFSIPHPSSPVTIFVFFSYTFHVSSQLSLCFLQLYFWYSLLYLFFPVCPPSSVYFSKWILLLSAPVSSPLFLSPLPLSSLNPRIAIRSNRGLCLPWVCFQLHSVSVSLQEFLRPKHLAVEVSPYGIHWGASGFCSQQPLKPYSASGRKCFWPTRSSIIYALSPQSLFQSVKNIQISWVPFRRENYNHLGTLIVKSFAGSPLPREWMLKHSAGNQGSQSPASETAFNHWFLIWGLGIPWSSKQNCVYVLFPPFWIESSKLSWVSQSSSNQND